MSNAAGEVGSAWGRVDGKCLHSIIADIVHAPSFVRATRTLASRHRRISGIRVCGRLTVVVTKPPALPLHASRPAMGAATITGDCSVVPTHHERPASSKNLKPGEKEPMHSHPAGVVYELSVSKLRITFPDGKTEEERPPPERLFGVDRRRTP